MNPEKLNSFHIKESHMTEGISADFVWYEASVIREALKHAFSVNMHRFDKVVSVMEARHKEHIKMLQDVMNKNDALVVQNRALKAAIDAANMASDPAGSSQEKNDKK
jgi:hypothetical protein